MDQGTKERRDWVLAIMSGEVMNIDLSSLDPNDEDDRYYFVLAEHPELVAAIEKDLDEIEIGEGSMNPRLHLSIHQVIANQIWDNDPPEAWATAERLKSLGYERHEILHMLGSAMSGQIRRVLTENKPSEPGSYITALNALPESWESIRDHESGRLQ